MMSHIIKDSINSVYALMVMFDIDICFPSFKKYLSICISIRYTGLPTENVTSDTTIRNLYCLFHNCKIVSFFAKSLNCLFKTQFAA